MKVLVIGSGGREHALAWKLAQSARVQEIFCAPGNAGTALLGKNVAIAPTDHDGLIDFARAERIDLTVVGPDDVLAAGLVDLFQGAGLRIFGPTRAAARFESSKIFAKEFMKRHGIPTAAFGSFSDSRSAIEFCRTLRGKIVIKADGLALGKGVIIAENVEEAGVAILRMIDERQFGDAGKDIVVEEFIEGEECSVHALVDGTNYLLLPAAQDHKKIFDGDRGPNTGGMGAFSPTPVFTSALQERVEHEVLQPFLTGLAAEKIGYRGLLYPGLIITPEGPKVLEFNCRFGDPETQALLPRLQSDLVELLEATIDQRLAGCAPTWDPRPAVCVVLASGGYPGPYETGKAITGLEGDRFKEEPDVLVFHAGTRRSEGRLTTAGGRVLAVTAMAGELPVARDKAYRALGRIHFEGRHFRTDIALRALSA